MDDFLPPHTQDMQGNGSAPHIKTSCRNAQVRRGGARCVYLMLAPRRRGSCLVSLLCAYLYVCVQRGAWRAAPARPACAREGARGVWCHAAMGLAECHGTSWWHFCRPPRHCSAAQEPPSACVVSCWMINPIACERARISTLNLPGENWRGWGGAAEVDREEASGREGAGCRAATTAATPPCYYGGHARVQRLSGEWQTEQQQANPIPIPIPNLNPNPNTLTATSTAIDSPPKARANSAR